MTTAYNALEHRMQLFLQLEIFTHPSLIPLPPSFLFKRESNIFLHHYADGQANYKNPYYFTARPGKQFYDREAVFFCYGRKQTFTKVIEIS